MTMKKRLNKTQLRALFASIQHWKRIVRGKESSEGTENCALCQEFFDSNCKGCPVQEKTGQTSCFDTPYIKFFTRTEPEDGGIGHWARTPKAVRAAEKELKFLKGIWKERAGMKRREYAAKTK